MIRDAAGREIEPPLIPIPGAPALQGTGSGRFDVLGERRAMLKYTGLTRKLSCIADIPAKNQQASAEREGLARRPKTARNPLAIP